MLTTQANLHHYLPRFYLKGFTIKKKGGYHVWVYERDKPCPKLCRVKNVAASPGYYAIKDASGQPSELFERFLEQIDNMAARLLHRLIKGPQLSSDEIEQYAVFVGIQRHRVPHTRSNLEEIYCKLAEHFLSFYHSVPGLLERDIKKFSSEKRIDPKVLNAEQIRRGFKKGELQLKVESVYSLQELFDLAPFEASIFARMKWIVLISEGNEYFVTSDNPVLKIDPGHKPGGFYGYGLASPTIEVTFPLNRKACLLLVQDKVRVEDYRKLVEDGKEQEAETIRNIHGPIYYAASDEVLTSHINDRTIRCAERFVYASAPRSLIAEKLKGDCQAPRLRMG